jgi:glycerophosphoryl diester phosphodiesterase
MTNAGVYLGHMKDQLTGTSNAGAVTHAMGVKVQADSYGLDENGNPVVSASGKQGKTIMEEAIAAGKATAIINSGIIAEPGTGAFLAEVENRINTTSITAQIIESGVDVILGGGEIDYLPVGVVGRFGQAGIREDGRNLVEEAKAKGYTVVYTLEELQNLPPGTQKVLGIFAAEDTYNDFPEEVNAEAGLGNYGQPGNENPPTVAQMLEVALSIVSQNENGFMVVMEEEGTDNFSNNNNAAGLIEAAKRADDAIGVAQKFIDEVAPNTLLITAADSDASGLEIDDADNPVGTTDPNPIVEDGGVEVPLDGVNGANTEPFTAAPAANGNVYEFGVGWVSTSDVPGSIVAKTYGLNSDKLPSTLDNTKIYELMYETLFETELPSQAPAPEPEPAPPATKDTGNVIFIHPDGTSPSHYAAARFFHYGPDGRLNWDMMSDAGVYLGHMKDQLTGTSNAGAVTHAMGVKVHAGSYGLDENGNPVVPASGRTGLTVMEEAIKAGKATAIINSGIIAEPGTGAFLAEVDNRDNTTGITAQIIESGVDVILGGGEIDYLPVGVIGRFGQEGIREDGRNLVEEAIAKGYTVVYTLEELQNLPPGTTKVVGIFAAEDTYNDEPEEVLAAEGLGLYGQPGNENPPTVAQMLEVALSIISQNANGFMVVMEEEGTDNFSNDNNAAGAIEAAKRADDAIGVAMDFIRNQDPNTLLLTAADSDAGGLEVRDPLSADETVGTDEVNPTTEAGTEVPLDGVNGSNTDPFISAPDANGNTYPFGLAWKGTSDNSGSIVSKAFGLNADKLPSTLDNTKIYELMYETLFGVNPAEVARPELEGFASLPADTFADGLPAGGAIPGGPFPGQPVQGFSGVQFADENSFWFLSDNGFGAKSNSSDYLLRIYKTDPSFKGSEDGDRSVNIEGFVQLSDPNNLISWTIVNENTSERLLTGSDFDVESLVVAEDGSFWIGEEFGPYLLHFDANGVLLEPPIATPNIPKLNTLNGQDPLVIGHRGASGDFPEHTLASYLAAILQGADFVEPDLVSTKDGVLIARHEPMLGVVDPATGEIIKDLTTTNVAEKPEFADRLTTKVVDGVSYTGWFAEDFTLAEIDTLRAVQPRPYRDQSFNGEFEIPTFEEVIDLVKEVEKAGFKVGIYPETKHPTYFDNLGLSLEESLVQTLLDKDFTDPSRIFIQSFEVQNLLELKNDLLAGTVLENTPLVQLYDEFQLQPFDIVSNFSDPTFDPLSVYGTDLITAETTYGDLINQDEGAEQNLLQEFVASYAAGIGPWKRTFVLTETLDTPVDGNGDGVPEIIERLTGEVLPVVEDAHEAGLQVHPYTFRDEERFLVLKEDGTPQTAQEEYEQFIQLGVDGFFTDFPETGDLVRDRIVADFVQSPDNPTLINQDDRDRANLPGSGGFEGMAYSPDRMTLYPLLEKSVEGDPANALRIYKYDVATESYAEDLVGYYRLDDPSHAIGDFTPINDNEFLVIERDGNQGEEAQFKKVFLVDFSQVNEDGFVFKKELVDLLNIQDPNDINGDGSTTFTFPFVTIENVLVIDQDTILIANDNNYPFSIGRGPDIDNTEFIQIKLPEPLNLDPNLGQPSSNGSETIAISEIQGASQTSALVGQIVTTIGIVTAVDSNGFYLQASTDDGNDATSEGIFVFTRSTPSVQVGDELQIEGTVTEFIPGGASTGNLSSTQLVSPTILTLSKGNDLPEAVILGEDGRTPPSEIVDNDNFAVFDPEEDGIDFYESLEGMRVTVQNAVTVSPTNRFGEIWTLADEGATATPGLNSRGGIPLQADDTNPERIQVQLDGDILPDFEASVKVGDKLGDVTGVVSYSFGNFEVVATEEFAVTDGGLQQEETTLVGTENQLTVASYNVLNLDPSDTEQIATIAAQIVANLKSPDILALQEIQDNNGSINDEVTDASQTLQALVDAIAASGGPTYQFFDIAPADDTSGGEPGGNIRVAYLYNAERVDLDENSVQSLDVEAFNDSRDPLVADFSFNGETVTLINNHWTSRSGSSPIFGAIQPFIQAGEAERNAQAEFVNSYVDGLLAENPDANVIVTGDLNTFEFTDTLAKLAGEGDEQVLTNLIGKTTDDATYSFNFQGNSQSLDHIFATDGLYENAEFDSVHVNADFPTQASDHEPIVGRFTFEPDMPETFTLQLLHASDFEAGIEALDDAPRFSAVLNGLRDDYENTVVLSSGDNYIPSPFLFAASDPALSSTAVGKAGIGRADIEILNQLGIQAAAFGNHEFDLGTREVQGLISPDGAYRGTQFPYLSSNLDFSTDSNLSGLVTANGQEASTIPNKIAESTVITVNGEQIGVVGATTPLLRSISSPGGVGVVPSDPNDFAALAAEIQKTVDELTATGINKVVLLTHFQQLNIEQSVAPLLKDVDIVVGGGSNTLLSDSMDRLRAGDTSGGVYPILTTSATGEPIAIVNTDGNYSYVGRLVAEFDENGIIVPASIDPNISGAYATDDAGVAAVGGTPDPEIVAITDTLGDVINVQDGNIFGKTNVFLRGDRTFVRTEETNLGNLTADANLAAAKAVDSSTVISIKNGGGIRSNIGVITAADGSTDPNDFDLLPPAANPEAGKEEGDISQLDISNSLRFNNGLTLLTLTAEQLLQTIEHGVAATATGQTPGQFPQISGLSFSYDPDLPAGDRILSLAVTDEQGQVIDTIVQDGLLQGDPSRTFRTVTLNFLAGGGDSYPFPTFTDANRVDLLQTSSTGAATFAPDGSEQDALAEYLVANFNEDNPFDQADVGPARDTRIQNVNFRPDTIFLEPEETVFGTRGNDLFEADSSTGDFDGNNDTLRTRAGNDTVDVRTAVGGNRIFLGGGDDILFAGRNNRIFGGSGNDQLYVGTGGGNNIVGGGQGADQFWLTNDDDKLPAQANIITDFNIAEGDVIGFENTELTFGALSLTQDGSNTIIEAFGEEVGILRGIQASSLSASQFVFA